MKTIARLDAPLNADTLPKIRKGATAGLPIGQIFAALRALGWAIEHVADGDLHVFLVTSPANKTLSLSAFTAKELGHRPRNHLLDWLRAQPAFLPSVSAALGLPTLEDERAAKARPRFASDEATCPCCFEAYKTRTLAGQEALSMVLHGYRRPGHGSAVGQCFGVGYAPFEHSAEGTIAYRAHLGAVLEDTKAYLDRLATGTVILSKFVRHAHTYSTRCVDLGPTEEGYAKALDGEVAKTKARVKTLDRDIALLTKKIDRWAPAPLPSEGDLVPAADDFA